MIRTHTSSPARSGHALRRRKPFRLLVAVGAVIFKQTTSRALAEFDAELTVGASAFGGRLPPPTYTLARPECGETENLIKITVLSTNIARLSPQLEPVTAAPEQQTQTSSSFERQCTLHLLLLDNVWD